MCIMEGQGVGGHVGDDFFVFCVNLLPLWSVTQDGGEWDDKWDGF